MQGRHPLIVLRDEIEIATTPEDVFGWLAHFKENYISWHKDHVACEYLKGSGLKPGSVVYVEEYLHGELHKLKFRVTEVIPNSLVAYRIIPGLRGSFEVRPRGERVLFIATLQFGISTLIIGPLLDWFLQVILSKQLKDFKRHMFEEGANLKRMLEKERMIAAEGC